MSTNFLERSRLERKVITIVNSRTPASFALNGLSFAAISEWKKSLDIAPSSTRNSLNTEKTERLLKEISQRISSNSDASKHTFSGEIFSTNSSVEACIRELEKTLPEKE